MYQYDNLYNSTCRGHGCTCRTAVRQGALLYLRQHGDRESESVENPFLDAAGGVGPGGQLLSDRGATIAITGHVGGNAARALGAGGIKAYAYRGSGSVADALRPIPPGTCSRSPLLEAGFGMKIAIASGKGGLERARWQRTLHGRLPAPGTSCSSTATSKNRTSISSSRPRRRMCR